MNPRQFLTFTICAFLAGCDTSASLGADIRQAGTSSETQTALQALADNGIVRSKSPLEGNPFMAARSAARSSKSCTEMERYWISEGMYAQTVLLQPDGYAPNSGVSWSYYRYDPALGADRLRKSSCEGGYMSARIRSESRMSSGARQSIDGFAWRDSGIEGMSYSRELHTNRLPSGFITEWWAEFEHSFGQQHIVKDSLFFGNRRYLIPFRGRPSNRRLDFMRLDQNSLWKRTTILIDTLDDIGWQNVMGHASDTSYWICDPIYDLFQGQKTIGWTCQGGGRENAGKDLVFNEFDSLIVQRPIVANPVPADSMGIHVLGTRTDGDSLRLQLRIQIPACTGVSRGVPRLVFGLEDTLDFLGTLDSLAVLPLDSVGIEIGQILTWSVPWKKAPDKQSIVQLQMAYPIWHNTAGTNNSTPWEWAHVTKRFLHLP